MPNIPEDIIQISSRMLELVVFVRGVNVLHAWLSVVSICRGSKFASRGMPFAVKSGSHLQEAGDRGNIYSTRARQSSLTLSRIFDRPHRLTILSRHSIIRLIVCSQSVLPINSPINHINVLCIISRHPSYPTACICRPAGNIRSPRLR